jgi:amino acid permease
MSNIHGESKLSFLEATGIVVGHGVGAGILAVPALAARNSLREILLILCFCYLFNLVLHLIIAELSYNNGGAQFISCFDRELFSGKFKKIFTWAAFVLLGLSVLMNVSSFLTGAANVFLNWFGLNTTLGMLVFYVFGAGVVFFGMKLVGICEKYAVAAMVLVMGFLFVFTMTRETQSLPTAFGGGKNALALLSVISFSLSAVMSTPQVVKGLAGDVRRIRGSIAAGLAINALLILLVTLTTLFGVGAADVTEDGALVDLSHKLGGWVSVVGYVFSLLALATSFWANTLNLRDIVQEQTHWNEKLSWLCASLPCLLLAIFASASFVKFTLFASAIQVVTGLGIILAYHLSRKRVGKAELVGKFGTLPFQIFVFLCTLLATAGSFMG